MFLPDIPKKTKIESDIFLILNPFTKSDIYVNIKMYNSVIRNRKEKYKMQWYKKSYRRNLVDMHINDWNEEFLSEFDPDAYFEYLKTAGVDGVMLYLQSHAGLCHYPTKSGIMHANLVGREDAMRRLVNKCRDNGISVVGYYSLIFNTREEDRHPEWRLVSNRETGTSARQRGSRYGRCCPNNAEYRDFLKAQVNEIRDYFEMDGIFYDMTYWSGVCYCESCRERFERETGISRLPDMDDLKGENAMLFMKKRNEWLAEFCTWITDYTHQIFPKDFTVSHNNAYEVAGDWHEAVWEGVSDQCDYCTGDLYGDIYDHSFCMKFYQGATKNMPFEYMVSRFSKNLQQHTLSKTQTELDQDVLLTIAHHGANFVIDAMDPVGTLNPRIAELIGNSYRRQIPYEPFVKSGDAVADVAVWYSTTGRYNTEGQDFNSRKCAGVLSKTLNTAHVPFAVIGNTASGKLSKYKFVFAPAIAGLEDAHRADIVKYVEDGGVMFFSGAEDAELLSTFFGASVEGFTELTNTYVAPKKYAEELFFGFDAKYPLAMTHKHPLISGLFEDTEVVATLTLPYIHPENPKEFASIHSNPPGTPTAYPAFIRKPFGKGTVIWSGLPIEGYNSYHHKMVTLNILREYLTPEDQSVTVTAPAQVEIVTFADESAVGVSATDLGITEEHRRIEPFEVSVRVPVKPSGVYLLPERTPVAFEYADGRVVFKTRELDLFDMYRIEF